MKNINSKLLVIILTVAVSFFGCSPNEPGGGAEGKSLYLQGEDASCTEAWLTLKLNKIDLPAEVTLKRDGETV
ncbi:MAG: hypothetical protein GXO87_07280, partial [Chlorobi bacterium]|nr:hypothetical protein [Chlorobiota bacterium]